ncbi:MULTISPECIES: hypothetical protein [Bacillus cereus group]|uniref:Uncharacterized protein n=1 Tax=Bacillus thuringiensis subsp. jegathesan TaxID=56955 RepID=A0A9X6MG48_BACTJ|nr:hypothetical protein [Bacillus thuringiensis]OUB76962.1 hypothetical protein BK750_03580 [Bacillus thuringiensis serovar jegathesan]
MDIIDFEKARKVRRNKERLTTKIQIVERIYIVKGKVKFEVSGEKEMPINLLNKRYKAELYQL